MISSWVFCCTTSTTRSDTRPIFVLSPNAKRAVHKSAAFIQPIYQNNNRFYVNKFPFIFERAMWHYQCILKPYKAISWHIFRLPHCCSQLLVRVVAACAKHQGNKKLGIFVLYDDGIEKPNIASTLRKTNKEVHVLYLDKQHVAIMWDWFREYIKSDSRAIHECKITWYHHSRRM